ncbi:dienelactone hydrolase family protein (plasmid) [Acuticoccus sp. MNP-M23]|uniref:dienelactone hydrolase family protein n=1 Tax=Acuticoccus sp. MNP-M23 TaxID=3072793 RepID=UPI0028150EA0|nr:dienelactone hydrolase family protein [Acuticoccus sp. MNP-M23]WMS45259.1 dienelactone hydrolase family protein [Acuticoccus sp. MNP-M23]
MSETNTPIRPGRLVEYCDGETLLEGYVVVPQPEASPRACVVLAHDWSGLTEPTLRLAERYAALGYVCFAIDAYGKRVRGDPVGDNTHLMAPLMKDRDLLQRRLLAGYAAAGRITAVDSARMAAVGYCFGGLCALDLARRGAPNLKAVVSFHGGLQAPDHQERTRIDASILLLHGWSDPIVPPSDVLAIAEELTRAEAEWQLHAYGHAQHAFTFEDARFPDLGIAYDSRASDRSWRAMRQHLVMALDQ